jgi:hypothetical protein
LAAGTNNGNFSGAAASKKTTDHRIHKGEQTKKTVAITFGALLAIIAIAAGFADGRAATSFEQGERFAPATLRFALGVELAMSSETPRSKSHATWLVERLCPPADARNASGSTMQ